MGLGCEAAKDDEKEPASSSASRPWPRDRPIRPPVVLGRPPPARPPLAKPSSVSCKLSKTPTKSSEAPLESHLASEARSSSESRPDRLATTRGFPGAGGGLENASKCKCSRSGSCGPQSTHARAHKKKQADGAVKSRAQEKKRKKVHILVERHRTRAGVHPRTQYRGPEGTSFAMSPPGAPASVRHTTALPVICRPRSSISSRALKVRSSRSARFRSISLKDSPTYSKRRSCSRLRAFSWWSAACAWMVSAAYGWAAEATWKPLRVGALGGPSSPPRVAIEGGVARTFRDPPPPSSGPRVKSSSSAVPALRLAIAVTRVFRYWSKPEKWPLCLRR
mmetsp:Transcript_61502/g.139223  ORF Transcript_61502/g.139223 Transcript_61502/m.139223 type:complete len:335 (-) Transcript_61502:658-1662(-)